jgi:hypothetical protein
MVILINGVVGEKFNNDKMNKNSIISSEYETDNSGYIVTNVPTNAAISAIAYNTSGLYCIIAKAAASGYAVIKVFDNSFNLFTSAGYKVKIYYWNS